MSYITDLQQYIESIPYGGIDVRVERANRKTVNIITTGEETMRYDPLKDGSTLEAAKDINDLIKRLVMTGHTGEAQIKLTMRDGKITLLSIFDKKETKYKG